MRLFAISNHGLASIALLVLTLWGVILTEKSLERRAQRDYDALRQAWPAVHRSEEPADRPTIVMPSDRPLGLT